MNKFRFRWIHLILFFIIAFYGCSTKQAPQNEQSVGDMPDKPTEDQALQPKDMNSEFSADENPIEETKMSTEKAFELRTLENGLEVYAIHKGDIPMATVLIAVKNGAFVETPDIDGLAHLYEHMFFKANNRMASQQQFMKKLDEMGIQLGPNMNAYTSTESVRYFFTIQSRFLKDGLEFMADALRTPKFLQDELEKEREVVIGEFDRYEASPTQIFFQKDVLGRMYETYFTRKNTIGSREVILKASPEQMRGIQNRFYVPNNSALFLVGDFTDGNVWKWVEEYYGSWERAEDPFAENPIPEHPPLEKDRTFNKVAPVQTVNIVQAYQGPSLVLDDNGTIALDLAGMMLGRESSALQKELVHSGLASSASFFSWSQRHSSPAIFSIETSPEKAQKAYDSLQAIIKKIAAGNFFTSAELQAAQTAMEVRSAYDREQGQQYALGLASIWTSTGSLDYYLNYVASAKKLGLQDIDKTLKEMIIGKHYVAGALLPESAPPINFGKPDTENLTKAAEEPEVETEVAQ